MYEFDRYACKTENCKTRKCFLSASLFGWDIGKMEELCLVNVEYE
jgi:hypothetical protein